MTEPWCIYCEALVDPYSHCPKRGVHKIVDRECARQPVSRHVRDEARLALQRQRRRRERRR